MGAHSSPFESYTLEALEFWVGHRSLGVAVSLLEFKEFWRVLKGVRGFERDIEGFRGL